MHIKAEQESPSGGADLVYIFPVFPSFHKFDMMYIQNLTLSKLISEELRCDLLIYSFRLICIFNCLIEGGGIITVHMHCTRNSDMV